MVRTESHGVLIHDSRKAADRTALPSAIIATLAEVKAPVRAGVLGVLLARRGVRFTRFALVNQLRRLQRRGRLLMLPGRKYVKR